MAGEGEGEGEGVGGGEWGGELSKCRIYLYGDRLEVFFSVGYFLTYIYSFLCSRIATIDRTIPGSVKV